MFENIVYLDDDLMKIHKIDRKGVSPIIATLLLIVIAVAAAVVTYSFVMGIIGTSTTTGTGVQSRILIEAVTTNSTTSPFNITSIVVKNAGTLSTNITSAYLCRSDGTVFPNGVNTSINATIEPGASLVLNNPLGTSGFTVDKTTDFFVKVFTSDGASAVSQQFTIKK
ncbi:MAG: archaellin/type IV pilin N-terminal domain-containing protein [Candidatus Methanomethylicaceae archaeon]